MTEWLQALLHHEFMQNAAWVAVLAGLACGIMGTYVVVRRIGSISGGIAHSVLGGMGIAYFLGGSPLYGAVSAAVVAALIIGWVSLYAKQHEDILIGALWAVGMAIGILFISKTPGYNVELMSFLFGNILMVTRADVLQLALLDGGILLLVVLFYRQFEAVCYDEEYARLRGIWTRGIYLLLLVLIALTVVLLIQVVGIILVIALLTLPAAATLGFARSLGAMMLASVGISVAVTLTGLGVAYQTDLPAGATIILLAAGVYLVVEVGRRLHWPRRAKSGTTAGPR